MNLSTLQSLSLRLLLARENWYAFTPKLQTALEMKQKVQRTGGSKHLKGTKTSLWVSFKANKMGRFLCGTLSKAQALFHNACQLSSSTIRPQRQGKIYEHMRSIWSDHNLISGNIIERVIPNGSWERQVYLFSRLVTFYRSWSPAASWIKHSQVSWRSFKAW